MESSKEIVTSKVKIELRTESREPANLQEHIVGSRVKNETEKIFWKARIM